MGLRARFNPGNNVPAQAAAALVAGTFVKINGAKTADGDYNVVQCTAGAQALGVTEEDVTSGQLAQSAESVEQRVNVVRNCIARVLVGTDVTAGEQVTSDANGKVKPAGTGDYINGIALDTKTTSDPFVEVALYYGGIHA